mmetsp:Transcript_2599/g.6645  ORF Transcript_2599/g.6645 Transcript_2599/m.6645 type:complete len:265 (+) Transcript_2599:356-1150(+)
MHPLPGLLAAGPARDLQITTSICCARIHKTHPPLKFPWCHSWPVHCPSTSQPTRAIPPNHCSWKVLPGATHRRHQHITPDIPHPERLHTARRNSTQQAPLRQASVTPGEGTHTRPAATMGFSGAFCHIFHIRSLYCDSLSPGLSALSWGSMRSSYAFHAAFMRLSGCFSSSAASTRPSAASAPSTLLASTPSSDPRFWFTWVTSRSYASGSSSRLACIIFSLSSCCLSCASISLWVSSWCLVTFCTPTGADLDLVAARARSSSS